MCFIVGIRYRVTPKFGTIDAKHLITAVKYIEMNPVRARRAAAPYVWQWSSARAHAEVNDDLLVKVEPLLELVCDWKLFLSDPDEGDANKIRGHERTGRAMGENTFLDLLEDNLQRAARRRQINRYGVPVFVSSINLTLYDLFRIIDLPP